MTQINLEDLESPLAGSTLAQNLNNWRDSLNSTHRGDTEPSYAGTQTARIETVSNVLSTFKIGDLDIFNYNPSTGEPLAGGINNVDETYISDGAFIFYDGKTERHNYWSYGENWTNGITVTGVSERGIDLCLVGDELQFFSATSKKTGTQSGSDLYDTLSYQSWIADPSPIPFNGSSIYFDSKAWIIGGLISTTYQAYTHYATASLPNPSTSWTSTAASWSGRTNPAVVEFDSKLWVIGGENASGTLSDCWYSSNGTSWTQATSDIGTPTEGFAYVYDSKMWIIGTSTNGGYADIRYSSDGATWTQASTTTTTPEYNSLGYAGMAEYNGLLYLVSRNGKVYRTSDMATWLYKVSGKTINGHIVRVSDSIVNTLEPIYVMK